MPARQPDQQQQNEQTRSPVVKVKVKKETATSLDEKLMGPSAVQRQLVGSKTASNNLITISKCAIQTCLTSSFPHPLSVERDAIKRVDPIPPKSNNIGSET